MTSKVFSKSKEKGSLPGCFHLLDAKEETRNFLDCIPQVCCPWSASEVAARADVIQWSCGLQETKGALLYEVGNRAVSKAPLFPSACIPRWYPRQPVTVKKEPSFSSRWSYVYLFLVKYFGFLSRDWLKN